MESMAKQQAFISLKDHKENFQNNPTCRLINPTKSEMGLVSKKILEKINAKIRSLTSLSQCKNTASVINWFNNIPNRANSVFIVFDIESFLPVYLRRTAKNVNQLCKAIYQHPRTGHRHNYAFKKISSFPSRPRLGKKR